MWLNVGAVNHVAEKVEASAMVLAQYIAKGTPILFGACEENAKFLRDQEPPKGIEVVSLKTTHDLMQAIGLAPKAEVEKEKNANMGFWLMAGAALVAIATIFAFQQESGLDQIEEKAPVVQPLEISVFSDRGKNPVYHFGDDLSLIVHVNQAAWISCYYQQVDGQILKVYPNDQIDRDKAFSPNKDHILSGTTGAPFVIRLGPPAGEEKITCYASEKQMVRAPKDAPHDTMTITLKP